MSIPYALEQLRYRRDELYDRLIQKGIEVDPNETLHSMIPKIADISGEGNGTAGDPSYREDKWFIMPEVKNNEIYLLVHLSPPAENFVAFSCTGGDYTVEHGVISGGVFVASGSQTLSSGGIYANVFMYEEWGDETYEGLRQVMLHVTGSSILKFTREAHPSRGYTTLKSWGIVDFRGRLPNCTYCAMGASTVVGGSHRLVYFNLEGPNNITADSPYMFGQCTSLRSAKIDTSKITNVGYMFYNCTSLTTVEIDVSSAASGSSLFYSNYNLTSLILKGTATSFPAALNLQYSALTVDSAVNLFNSLPRISTTRIVTISNTPASYAGLTAEQKAIATNKNWTVSA